MKTPLIHVLILAFLLNTFGASPARAQEVSLPVAGSMLELSRPYMPVEVKGLMVHPDDPFKFDFLIDSGDTGFKGQALRQESLKLIKYFLAALTVPENQMWVNLSPYEKDRIIPESFGDTEMGRDLLAQDYVLKQLTASLTYPEKEMGKQFWDKVYKEAREQFGTASIPVNTFNKVWIVPQKASIYEHNNGAFIVESRLKVMLEEDYLALTKNTKAASPQHNVATQIVRQIIIPALEQEVNEGAHFANLRQIYTAMVLATWYKIRLKNSILGQAYVDKDKTKGIALNDAQANERIYRQYLEAFKKGVYNYIKEDRGPQGETIPRKYVSGGFDSAMLGKVVTAGLETKITDAAQMAAKGDMAMVTFKATDKPGAVDTDQAKDQAMTVSRRTVILTTAAAAVAAGVPGYSWVKNTSIQSEEVTRRLQPASGPVNAEDLQRITAKVNEAINNGKATRAFWQDIFLALPPSLPVSMVVTPQVIRSSYEQFPQARQLDNLFNAMRLVQREGVFNRGDLLYRYLSEIRDDQMPEFSRYFSVLKPGTRHRVLLIFYRRLRNDLEVLEKADSRRSFISSYRVLLEQSQRMQRLYGQLAQMLNRIIKPVEAGGPARGPEVSLVLPALPDGPVAPAPIIAMTRQQGINAIFRTFEKVIKDYGDRGYKVVLPKHENINASELAAMLNGEAGGRLVSSYLDNGRMRELSKWVEETTAPSNPGAHRITQEELLRKAMELYTNAGAQSVDLFGAVVTIGQYLRSMDTQPSSYIWDYFDYGWLMASLDPNNKAEVDDQGRIVYTWSAVNADGDITSPRLRPDGDTNFPIRLFYNAARDFYLPWTALLTAFYTTVKPSRELEEDFMAARRIYERPAARLPGSYKTFEVLTRIYRNLTFDLENNEIITLPVLYKNFQTTWMKWSFMGVEESGFWEKVFLKAWPDGRQGSLAMFAVTGRMLAENTLSNLEFVSTAADRAMTATALYRHVIGEERRPAEWKDVRPLVLGALERRMNIPQLAKELFDKNLIDERMRDAMPILGYIEQDDLLNLEEYGMRGGRIKNEDLTYNWFNSLKFDRRQVTVVDQKDIAHTLARMHKGSLRQLLSMGVLTSDEFRALTSEEKDDAKRLQEFRDLGDEGRDLVRRIAVILKDYDDHLSAKQARLMRKRLVPLGSVDMLQDYYGLSAADMTTILVDRPNFASWVPEARAVVDDISEAVGGESTAWIIVIGYGLKGVREWVAEMAPEVRQYQQANPRMPGKTAWRHFLRDIPPEDGDTDQAMTAGEFFRIPALALGLLVAAPAGLATDTFQLGVPMELRDKTILLGHKHADPFLGALLSFQLRLSVIFSDEEKGQFRARLDKIMERWVPETNQSYREDMGQLRKIFSSPGPKKLLGVEFNPQEWERHMQDGRRDFTHIPEILRELGYPSETVKKYADELFLYLYGPAVYLAVSNDPIAARFETMPLLNEEAQAQEIRDLGDFYVKYIHLLWTVAPQLMQSNEVLTRQDLPASMRELTQFLEDLVLGKAQRQGPREAAVLDLFTEGPREMAADLLDEISKLKESVREVDRRIAASIRTLQEKNIVVIIGAGHLPGLIEFLQKKDGAMLARDLKTAEAVEALIGDLNGWERSAQAPYPSISAKFQLNHDLAAVLLGKTKVAMVPPKADDAVQEALLERIRWKNNFAIKFGRVPDTGKVEMIVGRVADVDAVIEVLNKFFGKAIGADYHRALGVVFDYPEAAIDGYIRSRDKAPVDQAMATRPEDVGGIDLNSRNLDLDIKRDIDGVPLPDQFRDPALIEIDALYPVIINIVPVHNLNSLLFAQPSV